jgi:hypothetical protein
MIVLASFLDFSSADLPEPGNLSGNIAKNLASPSTAGHRRAE